MLALLQYLIKHYIIGKQKMKSLAKRKEGLFYTFFVQIFFPAIYTYNIKNLFQHQHDVDIGLNRS